MKTSLFYYNLPTDRIALFPPRERGTTNLLVLDRKKNCMEHRKYFDVVDYIKPGDIVVLNSTKVDKVRVFLENKRNGKEIQCIFLNKIFLGDKTDETWEALLGRIKDIKEGDVLESQSGFVTVGKRITEGIFQIRAEKGVVDEIVKTTGHIPLPPYIKRKDTKSDIKRYNTVFAKIVGSAASPTASINITPSMLERLKEKGAEIAEVELKVGWGTFAPIRSEKIEDHKIHSEHIKISKQAAEKINKVIKEGGHVWAFGTTVSRTLESCAIKKEGRCFVKPFEGETSLYIYPGYEWKIVNHMITNFHAPNGSLIVLVSSFVGYDNVMKAYEEAIERKYNFLSYGDSMLII